MNRNRFTPEERAEQKRLIRELWERFYKPVTRKIKSPAIDTEGRTADPHRAMSA